MLEPQPQGQVTPEQVVASVATGPVHLWHQVLHAFAVDLAWHRHAAAAAHSYSMLCSGTHVWV